MSYIGYVPAAKPLTSADITDGVITSAKIVDGTIALADLSATGTKDSTTFLRGDNTFASISTTPNVASGIAYTNQTVSSQSFTDLTSVTASITPSSSSKKILIIGRIQLNTGTSSTGFGWKLIRGSTTILESDNASALFDTYGDGYRIAPYVYVDSPATTSSTTYKIQVAGYDTSSITFNSGGHSAIQLVEI